MNCISSFLRQIAKPSQLFEKEVLAGFHALLIDKADPAFLRLGPVPIQYAFCLLILECSRRGVGDSSIVLTLRTLGSGALAVQAWQGIKLLPLKTAEEQSLAGHSASSYLTERSCTGKAFLPLLNHIEHGS